MHRAPRRIVWLLAYVLLALAASPAHPQTPERFSQAAFERWLAQDADRAPAFAAFEAFLAEEGVGGVAPTFQLWRTATSSAACQADAFVAPPREAWPHIVGALAFVRDAVIPAIGPVEVVSGYRDDALNACAGGARRSAHRAFYAADLIPVQTIEKATLARALCAAHARLGAAGGIGLGFYSGMRFHVDAKGLRTWGVDGRSASSPCRAQR